MAMSAAGAGRRPLRADARRNRERLVAIALPTFAEQGSDASLEEIARRAGVGIGTLYRHFPTRDALLAAVMIGQYEEFRRAGERLLATLPPDEALRELTALILRHSKTFRCMTDAVKTAAHDEHSELHKAWLGMREVGERIVAAGQQAGTLRTDTDFRDVMMMTMAIAWTADRPASDQSPERTERLFRVMLDGLRPS